MLIEKVHNPLVKFEGYHCFGCCKHNDKGLHLDFFRKDNRIWSVWQPDRDLQGYFNLLHGGIQATLVDEVGAWWVYLVAGTSGLTSRLDIRYRKSVSVTDGNIFIDAAELERRRNIFTLRIRLIDHKLNICAVAGIDYFTFPTQKAMQNMFYPGLSAFEGEMVESADYGFPDALFELA